MNNRIKEIMLDSGYAAPELAVRANILIDNLLKEVYKVIETNGYTQEDYSYHEVITDLKEHFGVE